MNSEAVNTLFDQWKYPENHKRRIREWITEVVNGQPITDLHKKGFNLSNVKGYVAGGFCNCLVPLMKARSDVDVLFQMSQPKSDGYSIRMQVFAKDM